MRNALTWGLLAALAASLPAHAGPAEADAAIAAFEAEAGIATWPRLDGCQYAEPFGDRIVGLVLTLETKGSAQARWDGRCHVPIRHEVLELPAGLPRGTYVVAATAVPGDHSWDASSNRKLRITRVLGAQPADRELVHAAVRRICRTPGRAGDDRDCADN